MIWSAADLLSLARLCSAEYMTSPEKAVDALPGMRWLSDVVTPECQASIVSWGDYMVVAIRGTQVTQNLSIPELYDDIDCDVVQLAHGRVHRGFYAPLARVWPLIESQLSGHVLVTGHSLGGVRAQLARSFLPTAQVVSFGAPRGADEGFWKTLYPEGPPCHVANERDFAPGYPEFGPFVAPGPMTWLHAGEMSEVKQRPGLNLSISDHSIDRGYIAALEKLAG